MNINVSVPQTECLEMIEHFESEVIRISWQKLRRKAGASFRRQFSPPSGQTGRALHQPFS
jgi:hypothetical protein